MSETLLEAGDIALSYPRTGGAAHTVLEQFSLSIEAGEIVAILGPSGVGKSSLLRVLAGLQQAKEGSVHMYGAPLNGPHPRSSFVFQDPSLLPWLTLEENVAFGLDFKHQPDIDKHELQARVDAAIEEVGLSEARGRYPAQLSGGMAQRAALARSLARQPEILLLDEPFSALDEVTRADMQQLLQDITARHGAAAILVTHDIDEALLLADRIILLGDRPGRNIGEWTIDETKPRDPLSPALSQLRLQILRQLKLGSDPGFDRNRGLTPVSSVSSRRQFLKLSALFTAGGALPLLQMAQRARAAEPDAPLRIGYLPITDATPLLVAHHNGLFEQQGLQVEKPRLFRSWAQIVEAFLAGQVNAVHLLSPMTVWARYGSQSRAKVVAWNHMSGSGLTVLPHINSVEDLGGTTVAIPFWYSLHNVVLQHLLKSRGLEPISDGTPGPQQVKLVVMAPSDMVPALANKQIAGYTVAEPFNANAEVLKVGKILRFTGDVWKDHACCVVLMNEQDLEQRPEWSQKVVNGIVQAQAWIQDNRQETARILSRDNPQKYTPHTYEALANVLEPERLDASLYERSGAMINKAWNQKRIDFQPYPFPSYTEELVRKLKSTLVSGQNAFLQDLDPAFVARDLVDDRFVKQAILQHGGPAVFGLPESFSRSETITT